MRSIRSFNIAEIASAVVVLGLIGSIGGYAWHVDHRSNQSYKNVLATKPLASKPTPVTGAGKVAQQSTAATPSTPKTTPAAASPTAQSKVPTKVVITPTPTPTSAPNTTNCLPADADQYDKYYIGLTNSQYIAGDSYAPTDVFYKDLGFAGLINTVNSPQTVVFAPANVNFNKLTATQKAWMNASPANMKSVLGWQIITSCVIWHDDMENVKTSITLNTLNGPLTYSPTGIGQVNGVEVDIWDWFTSNGAVHISGLFVPPTVQ